MPDDPTRPPEEVLELARGRSAARAARDFAAADRLRAAIEAAGWKVVDRGVDSSLEPAHPPDRTDGARVRYGASGSVPSRVAALGEFPQRILVATDWPGDLTRALKGLRRHLPAGIQVVIVADDPSTEQAVALDAPEPLDGSQPAGGSDGDLEIVWTSARLGTAAALDCGIRRAIGPVIILLDTSLEPTGDFVSPLVSVLEDPSVAVVGGWGIVSDDLRTFRDAPPGDVDAIEGYCLAFRRADFVARGPLDERFRFYRNLDIWWSLVLRDEGESAPPRRAVRTQPLPFERHEHRGYAGLPNAERDRLSKRNFYRIIDRFGRRLDLVSGSPKVSSGARSGRTGRLPQ